MVIWFFFYYTSLFLWESIYFILESESEVVQSCPTLCDPMNVTYQAPWSMGFSKQEYLSGLPFPSPSDLPNPGIEPGSPALQTDALPSESLEALMLNNDLNVTLTILRTLLFLWITKYKLDYFYYLFIYFWLWCCGMQVPQPGVEPVPPVAEAQRLNHWLPGKSLIIFIEIDIRTPQTKSSKKCSPPKYLIFMREYHQNQSDLYKLRYVVQV